MGVERRKRTRDDDIDLGRVVIPGLTREAVFFWIPAAVYPDENRGGIDAQYRV